MVSVLGFRIQCFMPELMLDTLISHDDAPVCRYCIENLRRARTCAPRKRCVLSPRVSSGQARRARLCSSFTAESGLSVAHQLQG